MSAIAATAPAISPPVWRRLIGFNMFTGIVCAVIGWVIGDNVIGPAIHAHSIRYYAAQAGQNDISVMLGYLFGVLGFLGGLGFFNYPVKRMLGYPATMAEHESEGEGLFRYFTLCTDHKVVAIQYLVGVGT